MTDGSLRIEIFVDDVERSASFYERVLGFARERDAADYVSVRLGDAIIGIGRADDLPARHYFDQASLRGRRGVGVEIVIEVDDIDAVCAAVTAAGQELLSPLQTRSWGARDFRIADPDGYYLRITSRG